MLLMKFCDFNKFFQKKFIISKSEPHNSIENRANDQMLSKLTWIVCGWGYCRSVYTREYEYQILKSIQKTEKKQKCSMLHVC